MGLLDSALGLAGSLFGKSTESSASKAAGAYDKWQLQQAQAESPAYQNALAAIAKLAGMNYTAPSGTNSASLTTNPNYDAFNNPTYATSLASLKAKNASVLNRTLPGMTTAKLSGIYKKGYSGQTLQSQFAQNEAQFNRDYLTQDQQRQTSALNTLLSAIQGYSNQGSQASSALASQGSQQNAQSAASDQNTLASLTQVFKSILDAQNNNSSSSSTPSNAYDPVTGMPYYKNTASAIGTSYF